MSNFRGMTAKELAEATGAPEEQVHELHAAWLRAHPAISQIQFAEIDTLHEQMEHAKKHHRLASRVLGADPGQAAREAEARIKSFCEAVRRIAPARELALVEAGMDTACCCCDGALVEEVWYKVERDRRKP